MRLKLLGEIVAAEKGIVYFVFDCCRAMRLIRPSLDGLKITVTELRRMNTIFLKFQMRRDFCPSSLAS